MSLNQLINKGISIIGDFDKYSKYEQKTFIVVGIARGGTSMVAGTLHQLGLFSGLKSFSPVFEDIYLSSALESNNFSKAKQIIEEYNQNHNVWVYKRPSIINYLPQVHKMFRNPVYLFIFKDIASIASRNNISMKIDIVKNLASAQKDYQKIVDFIQNNKDLEGLILSYDKIIHYKEDFLSILIKLLDNIEIRKENIENARKFIEPNPVEYLDKSRITKGRGNVDQISDHSVSGWACYLYDSKSPIVELFINGKKVAQAKANIYRKDIKEKAIHPTGFCGFSFALPKNTISKQDVISVKIVDDIDYLPIGENAKRYFND